MDASPAEIRRETLAFAALDSEVRLAILDALYERTVEPGPLADDATYSTIKSAVGVDDSGRFSYHLDRLVDRFVVKTDDGYRLTEPGREVVRLRRRGVLMTDVHVDSHPVDAECYRCGERLETSYENGLLITRCPACPGLLTHETAPDGAVSAITYPPSGVQGVSIETAFERAHVRVERQIHTMAAGFCAECGHDVVPTLLPVTSSEEADGGDGRYTHDGLVTLSCTHCGQRRVTHALHAAAEREPIASFWRDNGIDPGWDRFAEVMSWDVTRHADRIAVDSPNGTRWTVDETLDVNRVSSDDDR
ncbi:MAG: winged helix-turn-helix domain-containing protein [Halorubrum sp.]